MLDGLTALLSLYLDDKDRRLPEVRPWLFDGLDKLETYNDQPYTPRPSRPLNGHAYVLPMEHGIDEIPLHTVTLTWNPPEGVDPSEIVGYRVRSSVTGRYVDKGGKSFRIWLWNAPAPEGDYAWRIGDTTPGVTHFIDPASQDRMVHFGNRLNGLFSLWTGDWARGMPSITYYVTALIGEGEDQQESFPLLIRATGETSPPEASAEPGNAPSLRGGAHSSSDWGGGVAGGVRLWWDPLEDPFIIGYEIQHRPSADEDWTTVVENIGNVDEHGWGWVLHNYLDYIYLAEGFPEGVAEAWACRNACSQNGGDAREFRIRALNTRGAGPWSNTVQPLMGPQAAAASAEGSAIGEESAPLMANFVPVSGPPEGHSGAGETFTVQVSFSEVVTVTPEAMRDHVILAVNGTIRSVRRVDGRSDLWELHVEPESDADVMLLMPWTTHCAAENAVCTDAGKMLRIGISLLVPGPGNPIGEGANTPVPGVPTITGTPQVGETLTADTSGIDDADRLTNPGFSYQWIRNDGTDDTEIAGATGSSYTLTEEDEGKNLKVTVSFTDAQGNSEMLTSAATDTVEAKPNTRATGAPIIDGIARVGVTLTADTSGIDDEDELTSVAFSYQWLADDAEVAGATGSTYTLVAADEGKAIKVKVSFTDNRGNEETLTSEPTGAVAPDPGPLTVFTVVDASTDPDTLLETLEDGDTLTLEDPDNVSYGIRVDTDSSHDGHDDIQKVVLALSGAKDVNRPEKHSPYSLYGDDGEENLTGEALPVGSYALTATAYDTNGDVSGTLTVSFTVAAQEQTAVPNTEATGLPTIDGFARVGETLTADTSGIDDEDGLTNVVFSYQWVRSDGSGDSNIQDATGSSYTLTGDDEGKTIKVTVSFSDGEGNPESLTSDPTGEVAPESGPLTAFTVVDTSTDPDKVLGTLEDGRTLALAAPAGDSYGIRVDTDSNHDDHDDIHKVVLALSGGKTEGKTEWEPPYSLYGDSGEDDLTGEDLPAGSYDLKATAYKNNGDVLGTLKVSFSVAYAAPAEEQQPAQNTLATGAPAIDGIARVGETLTADTSGINDDDGLTRRVQLPVGKERRERRYQHSGRHRLQLHPGQGRRGQDHQGDSLLHRCRRQPRDADQRPHTRG